MAAGPRCFMLLLSPTTSTSPGDILVIAALFSNTYYQTSVVYVRSYVGRGGAIIPDFFSGPGENWMSGANLLLYLFALGFCADVEEK